jgi:hypothetical protein
VQAVVRYCVSVACYRPMPVLCLCAQYGQRAISNVRSVCSVAASRWGVRHGTELRHPGRAEHQTHAGAAGPLSS